MQHIYIYIYIYVYIYLFILFIFVFIFFFPAPSLIAAFYAEEIPWLNNTHYIIIIILLHVAKTKVSNFRRVGTAFSDKLPQARTLLLVRSYSGEIFNRRNLLTRRRKLARHIACCVRSAVK